MQPLGFDFDFDFYGQANMEYVSTAIADAISRFGMVIRGGAVVVAVSGGPDSVCLLHALSSLRSRLDIRLTAAHFEHGIRGEASLLDAEYVSTLSKALDVPLELEHGNIPDLAHARGVSLQVAAREERHRFLRRVAVRVCDSGCERIALGHTADDRAETLLLNLLRGTGIDGLAAMGPVHLPLIRPLIELTRHDIESYCIATELTPRHDASNTKWSYPRNRIRGELLPNLEAHYNPGVKRSLIRLAQLAADDVEVLEAVAEDLISAARVERDGYSKLHLELRASVLKSAHVSVLRRAIRRAIQEVRGTLNDIEMSMVEAIRCGLDEARTTVYMLPLTDILFSQVTVRVNSDVLHVCCVPAAILPGEPCHVENTHSSVLGQNEFRSMVRIENTTAEEYCSQHENRELDSPYDFVLRADVAELGFVLRSWRAGDRIRPRGMAGTKKLQDLYTDSKVKSADRYQWPVLALQQDDACIVAVPGIRAGEICLTSKQVRKLRNESPETPLVIVHIIDLPLTSRDNN